MQSGVLFIVLAAIFVVILYLVFSGSLQGIGIQKLNLSLPRSSSSVATRGTDGAHATTTQNINTGKGTGTKIETKPTSTIDPRTIPEGFKVEQLSPYFRKIFFSGVSAGSVYSLGTVALRASNLDEGQSVNVTGWLIKGKRGGQYIPKAVEVYDPSGLAPETDIVLKKGETLQIYTSASAVGRNLRLNKCIGYLQNVSKFTPSFPSNCPRPDRSELENFSSKCYDYVLSLGSCSLPKPNVLLPFNDYACRAYLDTINYKGCFERYRSDSDFLSKEWRVWVGSRFLDERHDKVFLFDKNGLLVDSRSY